MSGPFWGQYKEGLTFWLPHGNHLIGIELPHLGGNLAKATGDLPTGVPCQPKHLFLLKMCSLGRLA